MNKFKEFLNYSIDVCEGIHIDVKTILFVILVFSFKKPFVTQPYSQIDIHLIK
jgi:hypothetical protein